jgi:hypothetical protein
LRYRNIEQCHATLIDPDQALVHVLVGRINQARQRHATGRDLYWLQIHQPFDGLLFGLAATGTSKPMQLTQSCNERRTPGNRFQRSDVQDSSQMPERRTVERTHLLVNAHEHLNLDLPEAMRLISSHHCAVYLLPLLNRHVETFQRTAQLPAFLRSTEHATAGNWLRNSKAEPHHGSEHRAPGH